jgi:hypothetical protein
MSASRPLARRATPSAPLIRAMPSIAASAVRPSTACPALLANAAEAYTVRQKPAVSSPPAARTKSRTRAARSLGSARAVASSKPKSRPDRSPEPGWPADTCSGVGSVRPGQVGSAGLSRAASTARSTSVRRPSAVVTVVEPAEVRPSRCSRSRTVVLASATFWWMAEFAKRVSASALCCTRTSACAAGPTAERTRSTTRPAISSSTLIRAPPRVRW